MSASRFVIAGAMMLFLLLAGGQAFADSESAASTEEHAVLPVGVVVKGPFFATGKTVEISGTVEGDLYAAGGRVLIDGVVNGDLLVAGGTVLLSGRVAQDVRLAGGKATVTGEIGRNLTMAGGHLELTPGAHLGGSVVAAGGQINLAAPVPGDAVVAGGSLLLNAPVGGTVKAAGGEIRLASQAEVAGDLLYWSGEAASIAPGARIGGRVIRKPLPAEMPSTETFFGAYLTFKLMAALVNFVSTLVLGLLLLHFFPLFSIRASDSVGLRPLPCLGLGLVILVMVPAAALLLAVTVVALPLALLLLASYLPMLYLARIFPILWLGRALFHRWRRPGREKAAFATGLLLYSLLTLVPVLGGLLALLAILSGLGAGALTKKEVYGSMRAREMV
jgi:cytoskeletal protein CcmA (bactofilin family)